MVKPKVKKKISKKELEGYNLDLQKTATPELYKSNTLEQKKNVVKKVVKSENGWEREFDKQFQVKQSAFNGIIVADATGVIDADRIKSFIRSQKAQSYAEGRNEAIEEVRNRVNELRTTFPGNYDSAFDTGYHDCKDMVTIIIDALRQDARRKGEV